MATRVVVSAVYTPDTESCPLDIKLTSWTMLELPHPNIMHVREYACITSPLSTPPPPPPGPSREGLTLDINVTDHVLTNLCDSVHHSIVVYVALVCDLCMHRCMLTMCLHTLQPCWRELVLRIALFHGGSGLFSGVH